MRGHSILPDPHPGSFMDRPGTHLTNSYVMDDTKTFIIGKITRVARNRFKWSRYAKPFKPTTKAKLEPKIAEHQYVPRESTAVWAIKLSHRNANPGA
jgi:hypothetical protein